VKYCCYREELSENFELDPIELPEGDELSKLIIYDHILKNDKLSEEDKIKLALKYQLLIKGTSLFGEIELTEKNTSEIKKTNLELLSENMEHLEKKKENLEKKASELTNEAKEKLKNEDREEAKNIMKKKKMIIKEIKDLEEQQKMMEENIDMVKSSFYTINTAVEESQGNIKIEDFESMKKEFEEMREIFFEYENENEIEEDLDELENEMNNEKNSEKCEFQKKENENINKNEEEKNSPKKEEKEDSPKTEQKEDSPKTEENEDSPKKEEKEEYPKKEEELIKLDLNNKEDVMKIINSQNFVEGYWDINRKTMNIKNKYETEFNKLKELKILNNNDIIAMTIIVIYFLYNNYKEIIDELIMIIKKGKLYIQNKTGDSYDNIIKMIES
jgi:hypothetical protein